MTYPNPFGMGGGGGFAVGPANNIFGATSGAADAIPLTVTPAANRAAAEAVRDAYATANPSWLSEYDGGTSIGIFLFWSSGGDNLMVGQTRIGGQWFDQVSITGVQGVPGSGHVSWLDDVYQQVVSGQGGSLHTDADIHATGTVRGAGGMILASRTLADNVAPTANGDSIYYDINTAVWRPGAPRVCQLPVPQTLLTSANQWQVLTYDGTNMSMQFPRFAGVPTSRLDALQNGDSVRYDSTAQTWYNSRTAGSVMARRQSTAQTINHATDTRVGFDTGDSAQALNSGDVGLTYDGTTNIGRFTNSSG